MNHRRLDGELAAARRAHGLKIYPYFIDEEDGSLREDYTAGSVVLSFDAQLDLTDMICTPLGGCDKLKDAQVEIERLTTGLLREVLEFLEEAPFDFRNGVEHQGMDEGNVLGWRVHSEIVDKIRTVLGLPTQEQEIADWAAENNLPF